MGRSGDQSRQAPNVGVGTIQNPLSKLEVYNQGWEMVEDFTPNKSTFKNEEFSIIPIQQNSEHGPHIFVIHAGSGKFLDPKSLYLTGSIKVVHYKANQNVHDPALPKHATKIDQVPDPTQWNVANQAEVAEALDVYERVNWNIGTEAAPRQIHLVSYPGEHLTQGLNNYRKRSLVSTCNFFPQALFRDIIVKIKNQTVSQSSNAQYGYKANLENMLSYGNDAMNTHLSKELCLPTTYWNFANYGDLVQNNNNNLSRASLASTRFTRHTEWHKRRRLVCNDKDYKFKMSLHTEFTSIDRFMPDNCSFQFEFLRSDPQFALVGNAPDVGNEYRIQLSDLRLGGTYMVPTDECVDHFQFSSMPVFAYNTTRTQLLTSIIQQNATSHLFSNIFTNGELPQQMFVFMVSSQAYQGAYHLDPFMMNDYNVSKIHLQIENSWLPSKPLEPNFQNRDTMEAYSHLMENIGVANKNMGLWITKDRFDVGHTIFAWDLTPDKCAGDHINHVPKTGTCNLFLDFNHPLPEQVQLIVVGVYKDKLILDKHRSPVFLDAVGDIIDKGH